MCPEERATWRRSSEPLVCSVGLEELLSGPQFPGLHKHTAITPHWCCDPARRTRHSPLLQCSSEPSNAAESPSYLQNVGCPVRGFGRAGPLWGQLCKLWEETVLPEAASLMLGVAGGGGGGSEPPCLSRTLFCGLEATTLAHTSPRSWCPASPRGLPPPGGNSALLTPTVLPEDAAYCARVTAWASVPYPWLFPVLSLGLRPSLSPAMQLSEPPPPGSWLRFHLWESHTLLPSHVAVIMRQEGKNGTQTRDT